MIMIWRDRISRLDAVRSGDLYRSVGQRFAYKANKNATDLSFGWGFLYYGLYVDRGTGKEVYIGNPGDIGRKKVRKAKQWYMLRYRRSVYNIREYMAESLGAEAMNIVESIVAKTEPT